MKYVDLLATLGQQIEENSRWIKENGVYIRGLQAENRNILGLLMEQRQDDDE
ncbi:MAG: hypothetical protein AAGD25_11515 [Cyanobacteria bacterium P01_F01_bin.150]